MIASTTALNTPGTGPGGPAGVHAMTDVTGFGLAGHVLELARGANCQVQIDWPRAAAGRRARTRRPGLRHRRLGPQLGRLWRRRGAARRLCRRRQSAC
jgi:hypothetical protein